MEYVRAAKFWPSVSRIDSAYGDRNLICSCTPLEQYVDKQEDLVETDKGPSY
jgi:glycine dehydrogenase